MRIFLVRHATPLWIRPEPAYHILPGPPLNAQGEAEARRLAGFLHSQGVGQIFTSPLERCQQTAWIVARVSGAAVEVQPGLAEFRPDETSASVRQRVLPVFDSACRLSARSGPVALLTHGGPIAILLRELGLALEEIHRQYTFDHGNPLPPAGAWLAERLTENQPWSLSLAFTPQTVAQEDHQTRDELPPYI